ncbi:hypothetical protein BaRGS_00037423 [Batillaria attramentaria]|uniref:Uncharacterized protein n=1 Tax=Batillaria attramentaria TaxID=370345 RepID=A0ABD0J8T8_9CAEN
MKTTTIQAIQGHQSTPPLKTDERKNTYIHIDKLLRMPALSVHAVMQKLTKNRLTITSFNHLPKRLHQRNGDLLHTTASADMEMPPDFEEADDHLEGVSIIT